MSRKSHKPICSITINGMAPVTSNPVLAIARKINMTEDILEWVDHILIATLDLHKNLSAVSNYSVRIMATVAPTPGSSIINDQQNMTFKVLYALKERFIEPNCAAIAKNERQMLLQRGMPKSYVDQIVWANIIWTPIHPRVNVNFLPRMITPEKRKAFIQFRPTASRALLLKRHLSMPLLSISSRSIQYRS